VEEAPTVPRPLRSEADPDPAPALIGPYEVTRALGRGGMAEVFAAVDPATGAKVAIKLLLADHLEDEGLQARFVREGDLLSKLDHPNLVAIRERGFDEQRKRPYLVLEYVDGRDLRAILCERPGNRLSVPEAAYVLERCAKGLAAAHAQGVLHRDVKLSNVLVTPAGEVKLTDFGVAVQEGVSARLTAKGEVMGTPQYIAPELLSGGDWSTAADVYSLGCFSYRILTGQPLYPSWSVKAILRAQVEEPPPEVQDTSPDVPDSLAALIRAMLDKDPLERPSAPEVLASLARAELEERAELFQLLPLAREASPRPLTAEAGAPVALGEGQQVGPFRVVSRLGQGAAAYVYLVEHGEGGRRFALKLMRPESLGDRRDAERFRREAESLTRLKGHPGVVSIQAVGQTERGLPYFVMDLAEGRTLQEALRERPPEAWVLEVITAVADTLGHAHELGLVHRDVKPENIILAAGGRPLLTDFGVARALGSDRRLTQTGEVLGTPAYMAPEQADRDLADVGPATDVYGLAAVLYEALAGRPPHHGATAMAIYSQLIAGERIPPVTELAPDVTPALDMVIERALSRRPEDRFPDGAALAAALRAAASAPAPRARPGGWLAVAALLVGLVVAVAVWATRPAPTPPTDDAPPQLLIELRRLVATKAFADALEREGDLDALPAADREEAARLVTQARVALALRAFQHGETREAAQLLRAGVPPGEAPPEAAWILALAGEAVTPPSDAPPHLRARLETWRAPSPGEDDPIQAALAEVADRDRARALAAEVFRRVPESSDAVPEAGLSGWAAAAAGEESLRLGRTALAALAFDEGLASARDDALRLTCLLGLARTELARGDRPRPLPRLGRAPGRRPRRGPSPAARRGRRPRARGGPPGGPWRPGGGRGPPRPRAGGRPGDPGLHRPWASPPAERVEARPRRQPRQPAGGCGQRRRGRSVQGGAGGPRLRARARRSSWRPPRARVGARHPGGRGQPSPGGAPRAAAPAPRLATPPRQRCGVERGGPVPPGAAGAPRQQAGAREGQGPGARRAQPGPAPGAHPSRRLGDAPPGG
jgi:serine/threonine-protein kinase